MLRPACWLLLGLISLTHAASARAQSPEDQPAKPATLVAKLSLNEPLGVFFADDFLSGKTPVTISVETTNRAGSAQRVSSRWTLTDHEGERVKSETLKRVTLEPGATDRWFVTFRPTVDLTKQGYYRFTLRVSAGKEESEQSLAFLIIPRPAPGLRPGSRFGAAASSLDPRVFELLQRVGGRWLRTDSACAWSAVEPEQKGDFRWDAFDKLVADCKAHDLILLPALAYAPEWAALKDADGKPLQARDAPAQVQDYADYVSAVVSRYAKDLTHFEVWNDPEIMGWTWKASAQHYRDLLKAAREAAKAANPQAVLLASGASSSHLRDVVFAQGMGGEADVDQVSFHVRGVGAPEEDFLAKAEHAVLTARAAGKTDVWATEVSRPLWDSPELTQYIPRAYVLGAMAGLRALHWFTVADAESGLFTADFQPRPAAAAYAVCASMLEDTALVQDLFPFSRTLFGALFKSPEGRKVAVLWTTVDRGTFELPDAGDTQAFDLMGNPVGRRRGSELEVPIGPSVVYLVSNADQLQFLSLLERGRVREVNPVTARALPFDADISKTPPIRIVVTNEMNRPFSGELTVKAPPGWRLASTRQRFGPIQPGQSMMLPFQASTVTTSPDNLYPISFTILPQDRGLFRSPWSYRKTQMLTVAVSPRGSATVDADLSEWQSALPLSANRPEFLSPYTPEALRKAWTPGNLSATVYTRWDDECFYFAAEVHDNFHTQSSFAEDPYALPHEGDSIQLAFGSGAVGEGQSKVGGAGRGLLADTDYEFALSLTPKGPELFQLATPDTGHQTYYPTNAEVGVGLVPDARIAVKRDDLKEITLYECALPWSLMKGLDLKTLRFTFLINDRDREARGASLEWAAGLGETQGNTLTFSPTWRYTLANQTPWTLQPAQ